MSVHEYETGVGTRYRVRWRDHTGKLRSKSFKSRREAELFDGGIVLKKRQLEVLPDPRSWTLDGAWEEWRKIEGEELALSTLDSYDALWAAHIAGGFGRNRLSRLVTDPLLFDQFDASLRRGDLGRKVGPSSRKRLRMVMSSVLSACVEWNKIPYNPLHRRRGHRKRKRDEKDDTTPRAFSPLIVERIRLEMLQRSPGNGPKWGPEADAALVSVLAYAGLRPQEALALMFDHIASQRLAVNQALTVAATTEPDGREGRRWQPGPTKTRRGRNAPLFDAVRSDLQHLRASMGDPPARSYIFPGPEGGPWRQSAYSNWRRRAWRHAVKEVAKNNQDLAWVEFTTPYACRRSFVSLRLRAGVPPLEVARDAGHSGEVMFRHYATIISDLVGKAPQDPEKEIEAARAAIQEEERAKRAAASRGSAVKANRGRLLY